MTARLGGIATRTQITSLELLSDNGEQVLMLDRQEDGSIIVKTRKPHESAWGSNGPRYEVKASDARLLGAMLTSQDQRYNNHVIEDISTVDFTAPEPEDVIEARLREKVGDCTQLDIERAKAANLAEEKANLLLQLERDHSLDKHNPMVDGCPTCERAIYPGHGDGSLRDYGTTEPDPFEISPIGTIRGDEEVAF